MWADQRAHTSYIAFGLTDQVVTSAGNFGAFVLAAGGIAPRGLGLYALIVTTYMVVANVLRSVSTDWLIVIWPTSDAQYRRESVGGVLAISLAVGLFLAALLGVASWVAGPSVNGVLLASALAAPGLLLQDTTRLTMIAQGRMKTATILSLIWSCGSLASLTTLRFFGADAPALYVLGWGGPAVLAAGFGAMKAEVLPHVGSAIGWLRSSRAAHSKLLTEQLVRSATTQAVVALIGGLGGLAVLGTFKALQTLFGPIGVLVQFARTAGVGYFGRMRQRRAKSTLWPALGLAIAVTVAFSMGIAVLPSSIGAALFGETYKPMESLVPGYAIAAAATVVTSICAVWLRAGGFLAISLRAEIGGSLFVIAGVVIGLAVTSSSLGAVMGFVGGATGQAAVWTVAAGSPLYWRTVRERVGEIPDIS